MRNLLIFALTCAPLLLAADDYANDRYPRASVKLGYGPYRDGVHLGYGFNDHYYGDPYRYRLQGYHYSPYYRQHNRREFGTNRHHGALHDRHAPDHHAYDDRRARDNARPANRQSVHSSSTAHRDSYYDRNHLRRRPYGNHRYHHDGISGSHGYKSRSSSAGRGYNSAGARASSRGRTSSRYSPR